MTKISQGLIAGATAIGKSLLSAVDAAAARVALGVSNTAAQPAGLIYGLELSNNASDAVNDIDVAAGVCRDSTGVANITLATAITKRLDAVWAVGSGSGGRDTGSIADGWWHVHAIFRSDTEVSDVLFSLSATAPTLPASYTNFRRLGAVKRVSGSIVAFRQHGDMFKFAAPVVDQNGSATVTDTLLTLSVPGGVRVVPIIAADVQLTSAGSGIILLGDGDLANATTAVARAVLASEIDSGVSQAFISNLASQLRYTVLNASGTLGYARVQTLGWVDRRGR